MIAVTGDAHSVSYINDISLRLPPSPPLSQLEDIPPEMICHGENKPKDCENPCMCTHIVDLPYNGIVELVIVDESEYLCFSSIV